MSQCLISMDEVLRRVPLSKTQIYRLIKEGKFPLQVSIGRHRVAFVESEVSAYIDGQIQLRAEGADGAEIRRQRAIRAVGGRS